MLGDYVRDKDAVTAALILTEMAAWYRRSGHDPVRRPAGTAMRSTAITAKRPSIW